ncbi:MAG: hypothetical protein CVV64_02405 [Candidatus Wallbacteria bacterium HGW-Wallbacteria-1]|uniref:Uncharacterized protein n=1 Tax=Candidatus Wallbacteria bacterium HGW-Wallbacteria-1 TaxID=2013854 RepID=A0A2N1PVD5_9BACT|nr:MAG: hypothetical protein CVV64_02405 [Candidatus Wallbacteria bacterium HGW-Wallbacteria-1]
MFPFLHFNANNCQNFPSERIKSGWNYFPLGDILQKPAIRRIVFLQDDWPVTSAEQTWIMWIRVQGI